MRQLIWKEWHEQSWRLGFGCVVLGAMAMIGLHARIIADEVMMMWVCFIGITLLPVLSVASLLPAERSEGTFESLLALPVAPWKILTAKTVMGLLLCAGPLIVSAIISLLISGRREMLLRDILLLYANSTLSAVSLFLWMMALTSRLPSEARAGLVASGILIIWSLATARAGLIRSVPRLARAIFTARVCLPILRRSSRHPAFAGIHQSARSGSARGDFVGMDGQTHRGRIGG